MHLHLAVKRVLTGWSNARVGALGEHVEYVLRDEEEEEETEMENTAAEAGNEADQNVTLHKPLDTASLFFVHFRTLQILKIKVSKMFSVLESIEYEVLTFIFDCF